jgi:tRNA (cmo5U34)-methyltransferase
VHPTSAEKFDTSRASEYARQSRIALAGYDACHDLAACMLAASLGSRPANILVVGAAGTAVAFHRGRSFRADA